jgi:2-keto-3-deoxy-L-rhamnonate aldolase RhmA
MEAVEQIDEIAAVDGVDLLAVGPSDLSRSLGVSGHPDHPKLVAAIDRVRAAVRNGGSVRLAIPLNHGAPFRATPRSSRNSASAIRTAPRPRRRGFSNR